MKRFFKKVRDGLEFIGRNFVAACRLFGKLQNLVKFVCYLLFCWITIFGVSFIRYEFNKLSLDNRISNLITVSQGQGLKYSLERIPILQKEKLPVEPKIYDPISVFKAFFPQFDEVDLDQYVDLYLLIISNKNNFHNLNMTGLKLPAIEKYTGKDQFMKSDFENVYLDYAELYGHNFLDSKFNSVSFYNAVFFSVYFGLSEFKNTNFINADLRNSSFRNAILEDIDFTNTKLQMVDFLGADLSKICCMEGANFSLALYNSTDLKDGVKIDIPKIVKNIREIGFVVSEQDYNNVLKNQFQPRKHVINASELANIPPTKFPPGFDPKAHGMIDISEYIKNG